MTTRNERPGDAFADAPAPALQRLLGGLPVVSAVALVVLYAVIGVHTGSSAFHFGQGGPIGRIGVVICWAGIMALLAVMFWTWVSSRLRRLKGAILSFDASNTDQLADKRTMKSAETLVRLSSRVRPAVTLLMKLGIAAGVFGLGLLVIGVLQHPG